MKKPKQIRKYMTEAKLKKSQKIRKQIYETEAKIDELQTKLHYLNSKLVELLIG